MRLSSWLRSARSLFVPSGTEKGHHPTRLRKRAMAAPLRVERLEDRTVPSTFTVGNLADSGPGSLRQAILDANANPGADLIHFAPAARDGTITLTSGQLSITDDLTIDGPGADRLAVSGNDASRVFRIGSGVTVAIDDLTITHGRADNGGGIWNAGGSLSLSHVIVSQNQALGAPGNQAQGGGVFNQGGTLTVAHSTFSGNVAIGGLRLGVPVTQGRGGGINSDQGATTTVSHSTFSDNLAIGGTGAPGIASSQGAGGGLFNGPRSALLISHSTFTRNQAIGGAGSAGQAGGDANGGGLHHQNSDQATVEHSSFTDNQAIGGVGGAGGNGGDGHGGGLFTATSAGPSTAISLAHCSFSGNQAIGGLGGAGGNAGDGRGGAAINTIGLTVVGRAPATLNVSHSTFTGNQAIGADGGPGKAGGTGAGGAIANLGGHNFNAALNVTHSTFADNEATGGQGGAGADGGVGRGGGIFNSGSEAIVVGFATLDLSRSALLGNRATGGAGGTGAPGGSGGNGIGGGILNLGPAEATVSKSILLLNQAIGGAGGDGERRRQRLRGRGLQRGRVVAPTRAQHRHREPCQRRRRRRGRQRRRGHRRRGLQPGRLRLRRAHPDLRQPRLDQPRRRVRSVRVAEDGGSAGTKKAAGEALTAKQAPHRPGIAPALGLRAGSDVFSCIAESNREIFDDDHRVRNGSAVAADRHRNLARVSARPPEWPHPVAAGVDREATRAARRAQRREAAARPAVCRVGTVAPDFELPDLTGVRRKLSEFREQNVLLIFFNPQCGFCTKMAADLAALPVDGGERRAVPVVVTTGDAEENRKLVEQYGIRCLVLLAGANGSRREVPRPGNSDGISDRRRGANRQRAGRGRRASAATGSQRARHAPDRTATATHRERLRASTHKGKQPDPSLARSRLNRSGLKAGAAAPDFRLPRIDEGELSLADFRGGRVLLVFSDPDCGPCDELAPQLQEIHLQRPELQVLVVSRRDVEANRAKAATLGLTFSHRAAEAVGSLSQVRDVRHSHRLSDRRAGDPRQRRRRGSRADSGAGRRTGVRRRRSRSSPNGKEAALTT